MYSPASPRKFGASAKNSPRKPLLSPSDITPFSFSSENLNLFDSDQAIANNGGIPMSTGSRSQPRTPVSAAMPLFPPHSAPGGRSQSLNGPFGGCSSAGASFSGSIGGAGLREYDENVRELRKENFNLKLRIYFLEERLGTTRLVAQAGSKEELVQNNIELRVQCESLKYDVKEKTNLLAEAGIALEHLETKLSIMSSEREEERTQLEDKLRQIDELDKSCLGLSDLHLVHDEDETLLNEVEQEIARGVNYDSNGKKKKDCSCQTDKRVQGKLDVLEERDEHLAASVEELEQNVEQLTIVISDTEACLHEAQRRVVELEGQLVNRNDHIERLARESRNKAEAAARAQKELAELASRATDQAEISEAKVKACLGEKEACTRAFEEAKQELNGELGKLQETVREKQKRLEELEEELELKNTKSHVAAADNNTSAASKDASKSKKSSSIASSPGGAYKIVHQSIPTCSAASSASSTRPHLQVVTQTLHIPPDGGNTNDSNQAEVDRLRKDMRKLKDYLKTSIQERKVLLKKIGTLNERVAEAHVRKSMSPGKAVATSENATQCNLLEQKPYWARMAKLQQRLASTSEAADLLRTQIEASSDVLEPAAAEILCPIKDPRNLSETIRNVVRSNRELVQSVADSLAPTHTPVEAEEATEMDEDELRPDSSLSGQCLPDPSNLELNEGSNRTDIVDHLNHEIEKRDRDVQHKMVVLEALGEQVEQKDRVIREQAEVLDEYRVEILRLRDEQCQRLTERPNNTNARRRCVRQQLNAVEDQASGPEASIGNNVSCAKARSEEEDSWSEPDVVASRKRMGLSQHVLTLIERTGVVGLRGGDSSEGEEANRLRYTGEDDCAIGSLHCLVNGLHEFSRTMDELAYQLNLSDTLDSGTATAEDDITEDEDDLDLAAKELDDLHVDLCHACSSSLPLELEHCLHRCGSLLTGSTFSLRRLRRLCSRLRSRLRRVGGDLAEKRHLISQLEEAVKHLGANAEVNSQELDRKTRDLADVQFKLNENYKLVAELSSENLRLASEKSTAEQLVEEVKQEQVLLRDELNKAHKVVEESINNQQHLLLVPEQPWCHNTTANNNNNHNNSSNKTSEFRPSSPETSASSFDFFPQMAMSAGETNVVKPTLEVSSRGQSNKNSPSNRGRHHNRRNRWKGHDYSSDHPDCNKNSKQKSNSCLRPQSTLGVVNSSDVSSPDLGVDVGSDPFSSLERSNSLSVGGKQGNSRRGSVAALVEENRRLKVEKDRLTEKLSQSKGALRDTLDRLHKKDSTMSPLPPRRLFSSAVAAAVNTASMQPQHQQPMSLKQEFIEFSKNHKLNNKKPHQKK